MLYKPKFCCHCGEKIERIDWNLLTSRRFCELCQTEFTVYEWVPKIGLGIGLILGVFFIGSFFQNSNKAEIIAQNKLSNGSKSTNEFNGRNTSKTLAEIPTNKAQDENLIATPSVQKQTNLQSSISKQGLDQVNQAKIQQTQETSKKEPVYFCGAETKKGKPCTRQVKGGGRCWQHKGKDAMLPENQLLARQ